MTTLLQQMQSQSLIHGLPRLYATDLSVHDTHTLESEDAPETFGWVLRECGTYLLDARMSDRSKRGYAEHLRGSGRDEFPNHYYWAENGKLTEVSLGGMIARMNAIPSDMCDDDGHRPELVSAVRNGY